MAISEMTAAGAPAEEVANKGGYENIPIGDLLEQGGANHARIAGNITWISDNSGLIKRCPECKRVIENETCAIHGEVVGYDDLRIKAFVADEGGSIIVIFNQKLTERLLGRSMDELIMDDAQSEDVDSVRKFMLTRLLNSKVYVSGWAPKNDFGVQLIAKWTAHAAWLDNRESAAGDIASPTPEGVNVSA